MKVLDRSLIPAQADIDEFDVLEEIVFCGYPNDKCSARSLQVL
jgi:hypothetical protein